MNENTYAIPEIYFLNLQAMLDKDDYTEHLYLTEHLHKVFPKIYSKFTQNS